MSESPDEMSKLLRIVSDAFGLVCMIGIGWVIVTLLYMLVTGEPL